MTRVAATPPPAPLISPRKLKLRRSQDQVLAEKALEMTASLSLLPVHLRGRAVIAACEAAGVDIEIELRAHAAEQVGALRAMARRAAGPPRRVTHFIDVVNAFDLFWFGLGRRPP